MAFTFRQVIDDARAVHPAFDRNSHPDPGLVAFLSTYQGALLQRAITVNPRFGVVTQNIPLPLTDFAAGEELDAHLQVLGATLIDEDDISRTIRIREFADRLTPRRFPCAYVLQGVLHLLGDEEEWTGEINVELTPQPDAVTLTTAEFILPDHARPLCTAMLVDHLASRAEVTEKLQRQYDQDLSSADKAFMELEAAKAERGQ